MEYTPVRKDGSLPNNNIFIDLSNYITRTQADESYVNENGDNMRGTLDMKNNAIKNLEDPKDLKDAANKKYVDTQNIATKSYVDSKIITTQNTQCKIVKGNTQPYIINEGGYVISELWKTTGNVYKPLSLFWMAENKIAYPYRHKPVPEDMYTGEFVIIYIPTTQATNNNRLLKLSSDAERSLKN